MMNFDSRLLKKAWSRLVQRPLHRWALVILVLSGYMLLTTSPYYHWYSIAQAAFVVALVILAIGFFNIYQNLQRAPMPTPLPTWGGHSTPPNPEKKPPYPDPNAPIDEAKRKMRVLKEFQEETTNTVRDSIAREAKRSRIK